MQTDLVVRIIAAVITTINAFAAMFGFDPLQVDEGTIYTVVSFVAMVAAWVWGFWKNNDFTDEAKQGTALTQKLKAERGE